MLVRVTEACGYFKPQWYTDWVLRVGKRKANLISKKAQKIGTRIDQIIRSGTYEADKKDTKEVKQSLKNFNAWRERFNVKSIIPLSRIDDQSISLSGEADFYWEETQTLIDYKSSKRIYPEYFLQLGGYKRLGFPGQRLAVLRCDKDIDDFEFKTNEDFGLSIDQCVDAFESAFKHERYYTHIKTLIGDDDD